jgi:predicted phage-related endonuclease
VRLKTTKARRLGATDAAPLLGVGKWANARDVYERIVNGVRRPENAAMRRGTKAEPLVRGLYRLAHQDAELMAVVVRPFILEHPEYAFATYSPDDLGDGLAVEYKTSSRWVRWNGTPPADYVLQCQWGMWVAGVVRAHLFVSFGEEDVPGGEWVTHSTALWEFTADVELQATFAEVGGEFWERNVMAKVPPAMEAMNGRPVAVAP